MLIQRASLLDGSIVDIRMGERIDEMGDLAPRPGEELLDAAFGTVIPGLHDHHVHLRSAAAALASVRVGPSQVRSRDGLARALADADVGDDGWIRAVGYHDSVAGPLDRALLDTISPSAPVRVQHRSGALWTLNSAGLARVGLAGHPDGRVFRGDPDWALALPNRSAALRPLSERLTAWGVTGVTDATPGQTMADIESLAAERRTGKLRQRLHCMATADIDDVAGITIGPAKMILDDVSLDLDELQRWIRDSHDRGRAVAVHCVTDSQLVVTIAALRAVGARPLDRIEHAAVVPSDCVADLADLGVTVVTQPNFVAERGDQYLAEVPAAERHQLWRVSSLMRAGVRVALSTDMPFGDGDPWAAMRAAVHRTTATGAVLNPDECVSPREALTMFLGAPEEPARVRAVELGQLGDLCVLAGPPGEALRELEAGLVAATVVGGEVVSG
jgi:predicted amidohydrolase YtcJ